jgi:hypothetical protein
MQQLIRGGQGRSSKRIERDGTLIGWCALALVVLALVALAGCAGNNPEHTLQTTFDGK